jgi:carboxymethylenebutenolidase
MSRTTVQIKTRDGQTEASVFKPDTGAGPWPALLVYGDGRGIRPALFELGERIAKAGYFVLLPDLFYRGGPYTPPDPKRFAEDVEFRNAWRASHLSTASYDNVLSDTDAYLEFLAQSKDVSSLYIGTTGYCLGGGLSLNAAGHFPDRVLAAASFHGGGISTDAPDSPHLLAPQIKARVYVAGAVEDPFFTDAQKETLIKAFQDSKVDSIVETYPGAKHGWVPSDSLVYNREASERHYQTLIALLDAKLKNAPHKN